MEFDDVIQPPKNEKNFPQKGRMTHQIISYCEKIFLLFFIFLPQEIELPSEDIIFLPSFLFFVNFLLV